MSAQNTLILDGGMGRELHRMGAPFKQPEWSALALFEGPDFVRKAHEAYINAGANIITANSYAVVPYHIGDERFQRHGEELARLAGRLGREAIQNTRPSSASLAGSLPPTGGSYRPDLFDQSRAQYILSTLIKGLSPSVDLWLAETQSSIAEAQTARQMIDRNDKRPFWVSFTLDDSQIQSLSSNNHISITLRSGERLVNALHAMLPLGIDGVLFNCSDPRIMEPALIAASECIRSEPEGKRPRLGVYANAFVSHDHGQGEEANEAISTLDEDLTPQRYASFAAQWAHAGASIIGGCCGIGPEHIAQLSKER
ncbi:MULTISPECIES: homocysteine S-methyltransferase family protein [unclassified Saccharibacter]|uniref:homocysteine S-methyltransferase family protein n=1 Tax=unclassified Saccharibacter TaxID=2648722 RepID=UPI001328BE05|nr:MULTISPECIES: homocysteine S-methyltransferase family protein [unclassified Saccharibacter]MXV35268.1 homocysteine S-methyltransferase [Saccharibacter sp. EH611]MXV57884.1 homocysteine S-methyltransferase [Saccharibacter sp. EH70]MXV65202.1 homocysteine S-methyltransferase [Saccharibacter sp. EH60]